jgi:hypothetical protein
MDINRHNYEAFLLDLLEGKLSAEEERELNVFLKHHPEHVVELPENELFNLEKPQISFPHRDQLKKAFPLADTPFTGAGFDMFSIARMEGDLSPQQEKEHQLTVERDPSKREEWESWQMTRLVPKQIPYPGKRKLKQRKAVNGRVLWLTLLSTAATLTLLFIVLRMNPLGSGPELSETDSAATPFYQEQAAAIPEAPLTEPEQLPVEKMEESSTARLAEASAAVPEESTKNALIEEPVNMQESIAGQNDSPVAIVSDASSPRPLRIAEQLSVHPDLVVIQNADRIEPLPVSPVTPKLTSLSVMQMAEMDRQEFFQEFTEEHNISLMSVANAGIKGINKLTGSEISLLASRDDEGDVSGFRLKSKRLSVTSPLGRKD